MELERTVSNSSGGEASVSSSGQAQPPAPQQQQQPPATVKKKRSLPGMPDPDAEVIALSPKTLLATNRFVCEICNKGFQRDQNLQLHRRGHNLPWKLRQRAAGKEPRKRVYVCPEPSCVHHEPSRALGDLTGIKKHFCRKHGEKKWKCDKCSKKYAVQSDWKAHQKTCGTREYRCDCGTLFSRRDSFITHRAFCDALAEESAKTVVTTLPPEQPQPVEEDRDATAEVTVEEAPPAEMATAAAAAAATVLPLQQLAPTPAAPKQQQELENPTGVLQYTSLPLSASVIISTNSVASSCSNSSSSSSSSTSLFATIFSSATNPTHSTTNLSDLVGAMARADRPFLESTSLCLETNGPPPLFSTQLQPHDGRQFVHPPPSPHMSATALLQKAAQMGATGSSSSFLKGFGLSPSTRQQEAFQDGNLQWQQQQLEGSKAASMVSAGLRLGLPYEPNLTMASSSLFGPKPATLDFLGVGMGPVGGSANGGLSAYITSVGSGLDMVPGTAAGLFGSMSSPVRVWEGTERMPSSPATIL